MYSLKFYQTFLALKYTFTIMSNHKYVNETNVSMMDFMLNNSLIFNFRYPIDYFYIHELHLDIHLALKFNIKALDKLTFNM